MRLLKSVLIKPCGLVDLPGIEVPGYCTAVEVWDSVHVAAPQ